MGDQVIKIIVKSESKGDEMVYIRHFIGSNTYFEDFKKKIVTRFPFLREKEYKLYWIDGDLDQITIFYEEDFRIFIENFETAKNRIYVEERCEKYVKFIPTTEPVICQATSSTASGPKIELLPKHKHVICDGCQTEIVGMRYKCLECKDFDICMQCEQKMIHQDHTMLRFYIPADFIDWSNVRFDKFVRKYKHHSKHHDFPSKIEISVENEGTPKENQEKCEGRRHFKRGGRHHGAPHHKGGIHSTIWLNVMKYMNDLANQDFTGPSPPNTTSATPSAESRPQPAAKTQQQTNEATNIQEEKSNEKESSDDFNLANLINMITKTSLGVEMVNSGVHKMIGNIMQNSTLPTENPSGASSESNKPVSEHSAPNIVSEPAVIPIPVVLETAKEPEVVISNSEEVATTTKPLRSMENTADPDEKEWDVIDEEIVLEKLEARRGSPALGAIPKESNITLKNMSTNTSSNDIPTLISFEENSSSPNATVVVSSSQESVKSVDEVMPDYAKLGRDLQRHIQEQMSALQDNEKEIYHRKPNVNSAVITMMAMGFSNEGGWLTQLLDSVDGNIPKALDLLQPNK